VDAEPWFDRIGPSDVQQLVTDVGPVPANVGAVLVLDTTTDVDVDELRRVLATRLSSIPRLRQRLKDAPWGGGRPVWIDHPHFDAGRHVDVVRCPVPGDPPALMELAVSTVTQPLDRGAPMWRARIVTGLEGGQVAVVLVLHHVLADGIGGLAVLNEMVDGAAPAPSINPGTWRPRPAPDAAELRTDAAANRLRALREWPRRLAAVVPALTELRHSGSGRAPRTSLNVPTGRRRRAVAVDIALDPVRRAARAHGGTVNDALLAAVSGALEEVLRGRGEHVPSLVVSVPVSARATATTGQLGNQVGVMAVRVPTGGSVGARVDLIAPVTRAQKTGRRGSSAALVAPAFRLIASLGLFRVMIDRQPWVNTFLTTMRGPDQALTIGGATIRRIIPVTIAAGNVGVAFAALSYAGTLTVSVITDPDVVPEQDLLAAAVTRELHALE
jgi:WS/DGAT/MGAT family acyltransferase